MFDSVFGLPTHILIIHVVVVLGPIAALAALAYVVRPLWRPTLKWPLVALAAVTAASGLLAGESGEALERRVKATGASAAKLALVHDHAEAGDVAKVLCLLFLIVVVVAVFWGLKPTGAHGPIALVSTIVVALASLALLASVTLTGHSGANASWADLPAASSTSGGED